MEEAATTIITLKLLIDTQTNKVLFAEASKTFLDFLSFLLTLPMNNIMDLDLLSPKSTIMKNMYKSLEGLNPTYFQKGRKITVSEDDATVPSTILLTTTSDPPCSIYLKKYYSCAGSCKKVEIDRQINCVRCGMLTSRVKWYVTSTNARTKDVKGYVPVSYMILDDLSVSEMSMMSNISLMSKLNVTYINVLKEEVVKIGRYEAVELLKMSFQSTSTSVLSDVFLEKEVKEE